MIWTDEAIETLKLMWPLEKNTAAVIAAALGTTRNAVIGKAHRLKLAKRPHKTFAQLGPKDCRYNLHIDTWNPTKGADEWCGQPVKEGKPYCEAHCRVAYRKASEPHTRGEG